MNQLTERLSESVSPQMAIIVYSNNGKDIYLEQRDIENGRMCEGRPLTKKCITEIIQALAEDSKDIEIGYHGVIPKTLLYADTTTGSKKLVWYNPPQERMMYFTQNMGIPDGKVKLPGVVFIVDNGKMKCYAFKGKSPKDALYLAPFFNVSSEYVCLGSAKTQKPRNLTFQEEIDYWEKLFWGSEFSHMLGNNPIDGNLATITKNCIKTGEPFPTKVLKKHDKSLKDYLK